MLSSSCTLRTLELYLRDVRSIKEKRDIDSHPKILRSFCEGGLPCAAEDLADAGADHRGLASSSFSSSRTTETQGGRSHASPAMKRRPSFSHHRIISFAHRSPSDQT